MHCCRVYPSFVPASGVLHFEAPLRPLGLQVLLTGVPLEKGLYNVTGCTVTLNKVSWHQPWSVPPPSLAATFRQRPAVAEAGGIAEVCVTGLTDG